MSARSAAVRPTSRLARHELGLLSGLVAVSILVACGSSSVRGESTDPRTITTQRAGGNTYVVIDDEPRAPENRICVDYCERVVSCWYALPNANATATAAEARSSCRKEQSDCRTPSTDTLCCSRFEDCQDFARCQAESRGVEGQCPEWPGGRGDGPGFSARVSPVSSR